MSFSRRGKFLFYAMLIVWCLGVNGQGGESTICRGLQRLTLTLKKKKDQTRRRSRSGRARGIP
jgi:hypothetical protein